MNALRPTISLLAAVAALGIGACGSDHSDAVSKAQKHAEQIQTQVREHPKAVVDKALDDAKQKLSDPKAKAAVDQVKDDIVEVPIPTP